MMNRGTNGDLQCQRRSRRPLLWLLSGLLATSLGTSAAVQANPRYNQRVLTSGLNNPRGLTLDGNRLWVSEAGAGGPRKPDGSNCILSGSNEEICSGFSGAIGLWDRTLQSYSRPITQLPSLAQANGSEGTGIADLVVGGPTGLMGVFGLGGDPTQPSVAQLGSALFAQVVSIDIGSGTLQARSNLAEFERNNDPDQSGLNSNPYAIEVFGSQLYVTDAGGNTLVRINPTPSPIDGTFSIVDAFVLPNLPAQSVPTGLTVDAVQNRLLIGELSGFPFVPGSARIFSKQGLNSPVASLSGFSFITDIASGSDGELYVLEFADRFFPTLGQGSIWRVNAGGLRERIIEGLSQPTGLAVAADGTVFVTNKSNGLQGELLAFTPQAPGPLPLLGAIAAWRQARQLRRRSVTAGEPVRRPG